MTRFYDVWVDERAPGLARARNTTDEDYLKYGYKLQLQPSWMPDREPLRYAFREPDGVFHDVLASTGAMDLYSQRARDVLEANRGDEDRIQWLSAVVARGEEVRQYWILHIPEPVDVLDLEATTWSAPGQVLRPVLSLAKLENRRVFRLPGATFRVVLIHEDVWRALQEAGVTGMTVTRALVR